MEMIDFNTINALSTPLSTINRQSTFGLLKHIPLILLLIKFIYPPRQLAHFVLPLHIHAF